MFLSPFRSISADVFESIIPTTTVSFAIIDQSGQPLQIENGEILEQEY